jgi:hypothetical protein
LREASSSDWPPERKKMPGTAGRTVRLRHFNVNSDTSFGPVLFLDYFPLVTMLGFSTMPSKQTPSSFR